MPSFDITSEVEILSDARVKQVEGIFDVPPSERSVSSWHVDLPVEERDWQIGLIVGPSGACSPPSSSPPQAATPTAAAPASAASAGPVDAAAFARHLKKLSSDEFEGRKPGSLGERLTTAYLKHQFEQLGLKPGNQGSWFQSVPITEIDLANRDVALQVAVGGGAESFAYKTDMIVGNLSAKPEVVLKDSDVVFVGYGVNAPEQDWNDYAGLVVEGKTVIVLVNDPGWGNQDPSLFKGRTMTYYGRWTYKFEEAARQGAAACFIVHDTDGAGYPWEVVENSWSGPQFDLPTSEDPAPRLDVAGWLTGEAARRLFTKAGLDFDAVRKGADVRGFKPVPLKAKASVTLHSTVQSGTSDNVVAVLPQLPLPDLPIWLTVHREIRTSRKIRAVYDFLAAEVPLVL